MSLALTWAVSAVVVALLGMAVTIAEGGPAAGYTWKFPVGWLARGVACPIFGACLMIEGLMAGYRWARGKR